MMMKVAVQFVAAIVLFVSCEQRDKYGKIADTPTTGNITIVADEALRPIVETEVATFNALHDHAKVTALYMPEADAITAMLGEDSIKVAIVTRRLTADEKKYLFEEFQQLKAREDSLAKSGIALIVNPQNPDTLITIEQIEGILAGKYKTWKDLGDRSDNGIEIVFDNPNSGVIRQLKDSVAKVKVLPPNCFAVKNNEAVVQRVSENKDALGLIGLEWISDRDDSTANTFLNRVKVVAVSASADSTHFQPYQAYLALKYYPLMRTIFAINREGRTGLGTGFVAFFASERGQRIVLKSGLLPVRMPVRIVQVNPKPFEITK
jgi:phosphate transport system substrate-binding protein